MRHGYTNRTDRIKAGVRKTYEGPDASRRARAEYVALTGLAGRMLVPAVLEWSDDALVIEFVEGAHGQDEIVAGHGSEVLSMLDRCRWLEALSRRANASGNVRLWQDRARATAEWAE